MEQVNNTSPPIQGSSIIAIVTENLHNDPNLLQLRGTLSDGWRKLVTPRRRGATGFESGKKKSDAYLIAPTGEKLRSNTDLQRHCMMNKVIVDMSLCNFMKSVRKYKREELAPSAQRLWSKMEAWAQNYEEWKNLEEDLPALSLSKARNAKKSLSLDHCYSQPQVSDENNNQKKPPVKPRYKSPNAKKALSSDHFQIKVSDKNNKQEKSPVKNGLCLDQYFNEKQLDYLRKVYYKNRVQKPTFTQAYYIAKQIKVNVTYVQAWFFRFHEMETALANNINSFKYPSSELGGENRSLNFTDLDCGKSEGNESVLQSSTETEDSGNKSNEKEEIGKKIYHYFKDFPAPCSELLEELPLDGEEEFEFEIDNPELDESVEITQTEIQRDVNQNITDDENKAFDEVVVEAPRANHSKSSPVKPPSLECDKTNIQSKSLAQHGKIDCLKEATVSTNNSETTRSPEEKIRIDKLFNSYRVKYRERKQKLNPLVEPTPVELQQVAKPKPNSEIGNKQKNSPVPNALSTKSSSMNSVSNENDETKHQSKNSEQLVNIDFLEANNEISPEKTIFEESLMNYYKVKPRQRKQKLTTRRFVSKSCSAQRDINMLNPDRFFNDKQLKYLNQVFYKNKIQKPSTSQAHFIAKQIKVRVKFVEAWFRHLYNEKMANIAIPMKSLLTTTPPPEDPDEDFKGIEVVIDNIEI